MSKFAISFALIAILSPYSFAAKKTQRKPSSAVEVVAFEVEGQVHLCPRTKNVGKMRMGCFDHIVIDNEEFRLSAGSTQVDKYFTEKAGEDGTTMSLTLLGKILPPVPHGPTAMGGRLPAFFVLGVLDPVER
ncbi:MAG: hypothetical protein AB7F43_01115 [Bacteriovoracia bacterium]